VIENLHVRIYTQCAPEQRGGITDLGARIEWRPGPRRRRKRGATNGSWGEAYTFDGFGNLTGQTLAGRLAYRHMAPDRTPFGSIIGAPYD
jgi:YD repeat-containing protein